MDEKKGWTKSRALAFAASFLMLGPILAGCGSGQSGANMTPVDDSGRAQTIQQPSYQQPHQGLSTGKKVALLAGAAALYYMYKKNKEKRAAGDTSQPQYYLSKNGRVYFRDQSGRAHWVTAPAQGIQVPYGEAQQYSGFQGYEGQSQGRTLNDIYSQGGYSDQNGYAPQGAGF
jgi:hypothetical protein